MKIAIVDACAFADIIDLQLAPKLFELSSVIHTTGNAYNDLLPRHQETLKEFLHSGKLVICNISDNQMREISLMNYPDSFSFNNKVVIYLAKELNAEVFISSCNFIRNSIDTHKLKCGFYNVSEVINLLVEESLLSDAEALEKRGKLTNIESKMRDKLEKWS